MAMKLVAKKVAEAVVDREQSILLQVSLFLRFLFSLGWKLTCITAGLGWVSDDTGIITGAIY